MGAKNIQPEESNAHPAVVSKLHLDIFKEHPYLVSFYERQGLIGSKKGKSKGPKKSKEAGFSPAQIIEVLKADKKALYMVPVFGISVLFLLYNLAGPSLISKTVKLTPEQQVQADKLTELLDKANTPGASEADHQALEDFMKSLEQEGY